MSVRLKNKKKLHDVFNFEVAMNLIHDTWIQTNTGLQGLKSVLQNSDRCYLQLEGVVFAGVLRLLLAICYEGGETSEKLLKRKAVSQRTLTNLASHHALFDLNTGFWICKNLTGPSDPLSRLVPTAPVRNNRVFHVHARDDQPVTMPDDAIACHLIAHQLAALDFGRSTTGPRHHSPCATAALGIAVGSNLLETLALNLVPDQSSATPSWQRKPVTCEDCKNQARLEPESIAERYTWIAQAVKLTESGVIAARGFKLSATGDPMTATISTKDGVRFASKAIKSNTWLTACTLLGFRGAAAATLEHAAKLGIPFSVRVIAQINSPSRAAVLLESLDQTFSPLTCSREFAAQVTQLYSKVREFLGEDTASAFLSYVEDTVLAGVLEPDLKAILERLFEDAGRSRPVFQVTAWLEDEEMTGAFVTYLKSLRPDQLKRIRHAWKSGSDQIETDHPAIMGWTRYQRLPRLFTSGLFASHPQTGSTSLIAAIREQLEETMLTKVLQLSLENLEEVIRRWGKLIPLQTELNHARLLLDLCNWDHPKRITQKRWIREFNRGPL
jgi:CRISPR-associated protein Cse1 (CRISPR_cse1)/CRISPR-associated protein Cse2 (CRISPR_cse2)